MCGSVEVLPARYAATSYVCVGQWKCYQLGMQLLAMCVGQSSVIGQVCCKGDVLQFAVEVDGYSHHMVHHVNADIMYIHVGLVHMI